MPPSSAKPSPMNQNSRPISSFFTPVKKLVEEDNRTTIKVNANLKSANRPTFSTKTSAFSYSGSISTSSSTDNLAESFGKVGFDSTPKKQLIDLTTPWRKLKKPTVKTSPDKHNSVQEISDDDSEDDTVVRNKRVLRERKPMKKANRIIFSSDEEAEQDDDDDEASNDEASQSDSQQTNSKKRRQPISDDSDDDPMETYSQYSKKALNVEEAATEKVTIERVSRLVPSASISQVKNAVRIGKTVAKACNILVTDNKNFSPLKKPRLTNNHYGNNNQVIVIESDDPDEGQAEDEDEEEEEEDETDDDDDDDDGNEEERRIVAKTNKQTAVVDYFNTCSTKDLQIMSGCKQAAADKLVELRPFADEDDLETKLKQTKGLSVKYISNCYEMMSGYRAVDQIIKKIENLGLKLRTIINIWEELSATSRRASPKLEQNDDDQAGMSLTSVDLDSTRARSTPQYRDALKGYLTTQPDCVNPDMTLKDYQILGVNWMLLLYRKGISGILADEMGLGKTAQVITFLGRLNEIGESGPHLIIVPSSTIQNWEREFERFCPDLDIRIYHGSQQERMEQRMNLLHENESNAFQVIITTYNLASGHADDRKFFKKLRCQSMILDEGHMIKNCTSARYKSLMSIKTPFRLLLTGTPLQNNLQELVSLLTFIMPETFANYEEDIRTIFKIRKSAGNEDKDQSRIAAADETSIQVLAKERINRAKKMMTPFVLRRKKENVLKDLPQKSQIIECCDMTDGQAKIYTHIIEQTKKRYEEPVKAKEESQEQPARKKTEMEAQYEDMSNVVIHLRKAADHPLLFRNLYTDDMLREMAKELHKDVKYWDSNLEYMYEDMTIMSDFELNRFCKEEQKIQKYILKNQEWMDSGKIEKLKELLPNYKKDGKKVLIFSQFTKMLDILELVMETIGISFVRLDGETKVMDRQETIDNFNENKDIDVFLLSTKAGGFGINLTSANIVILYDIDFNPQNDKQAEDRAHRVGQTRDVIIHKLISNGSIEEYILRMANVKLSLDRNISANDDEMEDETSAERKGIHSILKEAFMIADSRQK